MMDGSTLVSNNSALPASVEPWLPIGDAPAPNVIEQEHDPQAPIWLVRRVLAARRASMDLHGPLYSCADSEDATTWVFRRGATTTVVANMADEAIEVDRSGTVLVATDPTLEGRGGLFRLAPWEGIILDTRL